MIPATLPSARRRSRSRRPIVVLTRRLHEDAMEELSRSCRLVVPGPPRGTPGDRPFTRRELLSRVKPAHALITMLNDRIDSQVLRAAPRLKIVANAAVGTDNIDLQAARASGVVVTNTPGVLTEAVADLTWALILAVCRRIVEADGYTRRGRWAGWSPSLFIGHEVHGKTLGMIGCGRIGQAVARRARGFSMSVLYTQRTRLPASDEWALGATYVSKTTLLSRADIVTLHAPLTPETRHLIGRAELSAMKSTACLINTARGPVVDERALVWALTHGVIAGAGLDVYEAEPTITPALRRLPNVVLLPHIGSASVETRRAIALTAARNVLAVLGGKTPPNPVAP